VKSLWIIGEQYGEGRQKKLDRLTQMSVGHPTSDRDFFSTHFDINYLPENQARTEALWEPSENGGRAACDGGRRVTFVARFCWSMPTVFSRGEWVETRTILCRSVEDQILSVSDIAIFRQPSLVMELGEQQIIVAEYAHVRAQREQTCQGYAKPGFGVGL
jgi:hypothetical protein